MRAPLVELGIGAGWLVGLSAASQIVAIAFASNPLAALVVQAVVVDLAVGKAGVKWDDGGGENGGSATGAGPKTRSERDAGAKSGSETGAALRGIGVGALAALAVALAVIGVSAGLGWAKVTVHAPNTTLGLGVVRAAAFAVRDALLYAGLPLYFVGRAGAPKVAGVVFGGLAAGAALCLHPAASPANVALAAAVVAAGAAFWTRGEAGWGAAGVVGGWALFAGAMFRGGLFDVDWKKGALAPGFAADGAPAWMAAGLFLVVAGAVLRGGGARVVSAQGLVSKGAEEPDSARADEDAAGEEEPDDKPEGGEEEGSVAQPAAGEDEPDGGEEEGSVAKPAAERAD